MDHLEVLRVLRKITNPDFIYGLTNMSIDDINTVAAALKEKGYLEEKGGAYMPTDKFINEFICRAREASKLSYEHIVVLLICEDFVRSHLGKDAPAEKIGRMTAALFALLNTATHMKISEVLGTMFYMGTPHS